MSISVITPHRNMTKTLKKTLESVSRCENYICEHIIVDDCSSRNEKRILLNLLNRKKCKLITSNKWIGAVSAVNKGCKAAKGTFLLILAADDWLYKKHIKDFYNASNTFTDYGLIIPKINIYYKSKSTKKIICPNSEERVLKLKNPLNWMCKGIFNKINGQALVNRKILKKIGFYNSKLDTNCDHFAHAFVALNKGVVYVPKVLSCFIKRQNSFGHSIGLKRQRTAFKFLFKILRKKQFKLLKYYYKKSGCLGREPKSLQAIFLEKKYSYLNAKFIFTKIIFEIYRKIYRPLILKINF